MEQKIYRNVVKFGRKPINIIQVSQSQYALTDGVLVGDLELRPFFPQSLPILEAKAIKNLLSDEDDDELMRLQV